MHIPNRISHIIARFIRVFHLWPLIARTGIYNYVRKKRYPDTIVNMDVVITECCTLRCRDCSNLMQYYHHPENLDIDEAITSLRILFKSFRIKRLNLLGGEPFVCQNNLISILEFLNKEMRGQFDEIVVITNGTIVPSIKCINIMSEIQELKLVFSNYGELSSKMNECIELCRSYGIKFDIIEDEFWWDCGNLALREEKAQKTQRRYDECYTRRHCTTLYRGKLYVCPRQAHATHLGIIPQEKSEMVDVMQFVQSVPNDLSDAVYRLIERKEYITTCVFCGCDSEIKIPKAIQSERPVDFNE